MRLVPGPLNIQTHEIGTAGKTRAGSIVSGTDGGILNGSKVKEIFRTTDQADVFANCFGKG